MAKQLNVKLNFQADTSQVQQALSQLTTSLSQISNITPLSGNKLTNDLAIAKKSAQELQMHLNNAFNVKTGNLDLGKLDTSLKSSGQSLGQLSANLLKAGSAGEQAFLNIQRAIGNASVQINQANGVLTQFMTTLKNTARWQISSSILHGFMGALQSAWGYAKDLDKSLNSIRIVTGYSSDKMAEFAEQANKAAKALSTTTTKYTDASLIFYQQGLSDEEVQKRTDITIKMANAAGQSAEIVSDQLTAVWNNFYDGSKSLEYYADVMTALGAATASSTDEIAGGLEKFAAIGETIGLSFEYAASALATITSNTRQSEEVVGTALKTIFARIQGLKLGESLEDGTDLNKYSEALQKVGISIFEQNGELKAMDNILDEMAAKWDVLSKAQQTALAQTVAGIRQYTQLIALMENWNNGDNDSMMANLETSYGSEGALQEQADIYADSWQAAVDRVKAASEDIYRDLFPTEKLTGLMDGIAIILEGVDGLVQAFGGLQGILLLVSSIIMSTFQSQIGASIDSIIEKVGGGLKTAFSNVSSTINEVRDGTIKWHEGINQIFGRVSNVITSTSQLKHNLQEVSEHTQKTSAQAAIMKDNMQKGVSSTLQMSMEMTQAAMKAQGMSSAFEQYNTNLMEINNTQAVIEQSSRYLTKEQQQQLTLLQEQAQAANEQMLSAQATLEAEERRKEALITSSGDQVANLDRYVISENDKTAGQTAFVSDLMNTETNQKLVQPMLELYGITNNLGKSWASNNVQLDQYKNHLALAFDDSVDLVQINQEANQAYATMAEASEEISAAQQQWPKGGADYNKRLQEISENLQKNKGFVGEVAKKFLGPAKTIDDIKAGIQKATAATKTFATATGSSQKHLTEINMSVKNTREAFLNATTAGENFKNKMSQVAQTLQRSLDGAMSVGQIMSSMASGFSSIAMGISSVSNAIDTLSDEDASFTTKLTAGAMAATMGIRGLTAGIGMLNTFIKSATTAANLKKAADLAGAAASKVAAGENKKQASSELADFLATKFNLSAKKSKAAASKIVTAAQKTETAATLQDTIANYANVASQAAKYWYISLIIVAIGALIGIIYAAVTAEDAQTKALRQSQEALQQSVDNYDKAKQAVEDFKQSLSDYQDGVKGLETITNQTDDLKTAVEEVNKKAKELIETYGLFGQFTYGQFGEIIIDPEALAKAKQQVEDWESQAASMVSLSEIQLKAVEQSIAAAEEGKKYQYTTAREYEVRGSGSRSYTHYLDGYLDPDEVEERSFQAGDNRGTQRQTGIEKFQMTVSEKDMMNLSNAIQETTNSLGGTPPTVEQLIAAIENNTDHYGLSEGALKDLSSIINEETILSLIEFSEQLADGAEAISYYVNEMAKSEVEKKYGSTYEKYATDDQGNIDYGLYQKMLNAATQYAATHTTVTENGQEISLEEAIKNIDVSDVNSNAALQSYLKEHKSGFGEDDDDYKISNDKDLAKTYAKYVKGWKEEDISYKKGTGEGTITNAKTGDSITLEDDMMRKALATEIARKELTDKFNKNLNTSLENYNKAMGSIVQGAKSKEIANIMLDAAQKPDGAIDYSDLVHQLSPDDLLNLNEGGMTTKEITEFLGLSESDMQTLGIDSGNEFIEGFGEALKSYDVNEFYKNMAEQAKSIATTEAAAEGFSEEEAAELGEYAAHLMRMAKESDNVDDKLQGNSKSAAGLAIQIGKMNRGINTLADNFDDWNSVLKTSDKTSLEYSKALSGTTSALSDLLNVEEDYISNDFVTENLKDIEKAATGDEAAIARLQEALQEKIVAKIVVDNALGDYDLMGELNSLQKMIDEAYPDGLQVGANIEIDGFYDALNSMIVQAGLTKEQVDSIFGAMGYTTTFASEPQTVTNTVPEYTTYHQPGDIKWVTLDDGSKTLQWSSVSWTEQTGEKEMSGKAAAFAMSTTPEGESAAPPKIEKLTKAAPPSMNDYSSKNKGGGSPGSKSGGSKSKPKKADNVKKSEVVERYKEINDELKETQHLLSKNDAEMEGLWGEARFKKMRESVKILKQENAQLEERLKWSKEYLKTDKSDLQKAASAAGINLQFDEETGRIINYTEEVTKLYQQLDAAIKAANADGNVTEAEQEKIDKIQEKIDAVNDAKDQYDATLDEIQSDEEKWLENRNEIWTKNFEELNEKLELRITINESDLEILEYYLGKIEDDAYASTEAFGLYNKEFAAYTDNLHAQEDYYAELRQQLEAGEISMAQYKEGLQQAQSDTLANAEALRELKTEMQDYYGNVIAQSVEDLALYTDQMEHLNSVLDHYSSIMDIVGKQQDYEAKGKILSGKANNIRNELDTYKKEYEMYNAEAEEWKKKMDSAAAGSNEYETYKKNWIAAQEAANEAQDNMLSKTEEWAEAMRACVENELDGLAKELEENLTGGTSFDTMLTAMERANSLQEEYLTTTNKIYETNKLMNQAQQEIDKTNNSVAKRKLKGFIEETNQLQKQGKLSQFELEIQQAKYDLLLAEIALEEAQQAKSTVRLQRDSEGNFGYVYTADSSQIAEAEQKLADAQNNLYNIGLEGANNYNQKYAETMQEMYDTLTDLQKQYLEGSFATEQEYQDAVTAAKEYYYAKLEDYSALHTVALSTDSRIVADAWSSDFSDMMGKTEEWKDCIDEYSINAAESLSTWTDVVSTVLEDSGLDDVDSAVNDITVESNNLKDAIIGEDGNGGLVAALQSEIEEAGRLSEEYITLQGEIDKAIAAHEKLAEELNKEFKNPTATEGGSGSGDGGSGSGSGSGGDGSGSGGNDEGDGSDSSSGGDGTISVGDEVTYTGGYYYNTSQGDEPKGNRGPDKKVKVTRVLTNGAPYPIAVESSDSAYGWLKKEQLSGFDTGGYTGAWGSYGKMAMLHEKELVLNKQDTENFLTSMEFLDNIIKTIDLQAANSALGGLLSSPSFGDFGQKEILEQNVKIEASFPNVQNRTEIEEAFETLVNRASQYAHRK